MPSSAAGSPPSKRAYVRFSDGKSAAARDGEIALSLSGVEITLQSPLARHLWPYPSLSSGEPLRAHAVDVILSSSEMPGATAFVPDAAFVAELRTQAPHLTARAERWRNARPWLAFAAAIVALIAASTAAGWSPIRTLATLLPESWRDRLGEQAIASMTGNFRKCIDGDGVTALKVMTDRLSSVSGTGQRFDVMVYDWPLMNAFAVPGDQIVLTQGLLDKAQSADEVAGILAHEMGHGIELHPETGMIRAIGLAAAVEVMMGGSSGALANVGLLLAQFGYTRVAEREADIQALRLLKEAGISVGGLGDFFKRVQDEEGDGNYSQALRRFDLLRTHPPTAQRRELVRRQAAYPSTPALDAASWAELKNICRSKEPPKTKSKPAEDKDAS